MKLITICLAMILSSCISFAYAGDKGSVTLCAEPDFPPFMWFARDSHGNKTGQLEGYTIEVMKVAFERSGYSVRFDGSMPWSRCMEQVKNGTIDFGMDSYFDKDRAKVFAFSAPYRELTPQYYRLSTSNMKISSIRDLKKYKGCGLNGYTYDHYGFKAAELDLGAHDYQQVIEKLKKKRCDYFLEELEVISGFKILGRDYLSNMNITHKGIADANPPKLHLIAGKQNVRALEIMNSFNQQIKIMKKTGILTNIFEKQLAKQPVTK